ncbi:hypothetical protein M5K25_004273 [Dendrobium thyrsiflorum]|uniref:Uncharacterized protein n=1 Tax=Dendrobium thyrsiflorum TaxID=117978 RepID=A0ABD0VMP0_DENTH
MHEVSLYDDAEHYVPRQARRPPTAQSPVIPASVVQGPMQPPAQGPIRPLLQGPSQVCIEADVSAADHVRSPFQFAVGHDVPPNRGRGGRGRGRSRDSDCPARNLYSRVPPPNLHPFPLTVESDSDDEMIDIIHHPTPSQSLSFADYNAFPTVRRHLIHEGGLVIDGGSDDDADVGRQDTSRQSFPHPRYGMRVEGASQQPSPAPPSTSVRGPLYSDSPSVHELHTLYVPPRPGWHASLFHSVGVPQSTDTLGLVESTADDEITFAPRLSSPFVDSCVERGLVPTTWTDGQARQQARVWRTDLPQTTRGLGVPVVSMERYHCRCAFSCPSYRVPIIHQEIASTVTMSQDHCFGRNPASQTIACGQNRLRAPFESLYPSPLLSISRVSPFQPSSREFSASPSFVKPRSQDTRSLPPPLGLSLELQAARSRSLLSFSVRRSPRLPVSSSHSKESRRKIELKPSHSLDLFRESKRKAVSPLEPKPFVSW